MKRLHVHVGVNDLDQSILFYSTLFGAQPTVLKDDYAKWMLDDPRVNFAISQGNHARNGIEHLGIQAESTDELSQVYGRLKAADRPVLEEGRTTSATPSRKRAGAPTPTVWFGRHSSPTAKRRPTAITRRSARCRTASPRTSAVFQKG